MPNKTRFRCPYCQALFPVLLNHKTFACPRCGHAFATVRLGTHQRGWMALPQVAWEQAHSQVIRPFPKRRDLRAAPIPGDRPRRQPPQNGAAGDPPPPGAARLRQARRRKRRQAVLPLTLTGLLAVLLALLVYPRGVLGQSAAPASPPPSSISRPPETFERSNVAAIQRSFPVPGLPPSSQIEIRNSPPPTSTPTPTPTATPLPAHLLQAAAWQATLEQAAAASHATQTLVAGNYAATQAALPPTLTAMAQERQATATRRAAEATARAAGPGVR
jgi:hypothetical protein